MTGIGRSFLALVVRARPGGVIINEHVLDALQTRLHVETLGRRFEFIPLDELPGRLRAGRRRPFCLLTFDDGKRSNVTESAAELRRLGVPAVFYLTTDFVGSGLPLWFDRYRALCGARGSAPAGLETETVKRLPYALLVERLEAACAAQRIEPDGTSDDVRPMSWDDARELVRQGFAVGAHGRTHATLTNETRAAALAEIQDSLAAVGRATGVPCSTFAFPNGNYTAELARHAVRCGARTVMTTEPTWVDAGSSLERLPRIQLFRQFSADRIECKLALAGVAGLLANPDGTGRVYRRIRRADNRHRRNGRITKADGA